MTAPKLPAPPGPSAAVLTEQLRQEQDTNLLLLEQLYEAAGDRLTESVTQLEQLAVEDVGWQQMVARADWEFSRTGLRHITAICRVFAIKNPLLKRGVSIAAHYVFGSGVTVTSDQETVQTIVDRMLDDPGTRRAVWGASAREGLERTLKTDGNVIICARTNPRTGRVRLRTIDVDEVDDVVYDPDDDAQPWFYRRRWTRTTVDAATGARVQTQGDCWHPAVGHHPAARPATFAGRPILWDEPVVHVKSDGPTSWTFGVPEVYPAIDWARAYTRFLEDWLAYVKSLARFAWQHKAKGRRVDSVRAAHEATYDDVDERGRRTPAGRTLVGLDDLQPISHTGAHVDADSGRPVIMMIASALEVPYGWLTGDPDRGNLATAQTLDRPTELAFESRRNLWADVIRQLAEHAVRSAAVARTAPGVAISVDDSYETILVNGEPLSVSVEWPDLTEHSVKDMVEAIAKADETGKMPAEWVTRLLLQALGVDDIEAAVEEFLDQVQQAADEDEADRAAEALLASALERLVEAGA